MTERSSRSFDRGAVMRDRRAAHEWLMGEAVVDGLVRPVRAPVSADGIAAIDRSSRSSSPERAGVVRELKVDVAFADLRASRLNAKSLARKTGALRATSDGGFVYTAALQSPGATAVRVHFKSFRLPPATALYLFTENGQVFGPYGGRGPHDDGEFWSHTVMGDEVWLQLRRRGPVSDADLRATGFRIAGVGHLRPRFLEGFCDYNASCVRNAECGSDPTVADARDATAHMQWPSGPYMYICTGGLLADTAGSEIPYFLTANHCISKGKDARNLENFFQLTTSCESQSSSPHPCDDIFDHMSNHPQSLRTLGADILSTGRSADYTLFQLRESAPAGSAFLGWSSTPIAFDDGADLFRISHPGGAPQAYSEHTVDVSAGTCQSWPRGDRIYSRDVYGATEGGSSGSPVLNSAGQVVGQLSGACGTNVNDVCDAGSNATVDGAFAAYYDEVSQFLDPQGCTPQPENCGDGIDNDCDGLADELDPDCDQGGGYPPGAACEFDSDCASNKCKGKPGAKTCR
ncbi:serine protease [Wenzhouxiangellaceae bacterium CH-27]|uniref:Serine protease n=2 Tax=Elongatibacter sediminis TaxID=3119006 RepID=A0AAW9R670_9GAMM